MDILVYSMWYVKPGNTEQRDGEREGGGVRKVPIIFTSWLPKDAEERKKQKFFAAL
jgi:hypothetical protein